MNRLRMDYPKDGRRWWQRPLSCLLNRHALRPHPGVWFIVYCQHCGGERNLK